MRAALRIPDGQLHKYCLRYDYPKETNLEHFRGVAYLSLEQLHEIVRWKSKRRANLVLSNSKDFVREITAFAFSSKQEESRIGALTLLRGVQYPTASVILHFCVSDAYPILDYRALWSLRVRQPTTYTADFWIEYVNVCRSLAKRHGMAVREFDKALWQYSKEHQKDG